MAFEISKLLHPATDPLYKQVPENFKDNQYEGFSQVVLPNGQIEELELHLIKALSSQYQVKFYAVRTYEQSKAGISSYNTLRMMNGKLYGQVKIKTCEIKSQLN